MPHSKTPFYEFGQFRFNVALRLLTRDGVVISLGPKAAEILLTLLRNAGEIVGKEDLMKEVWPDSFVEEANLTQNIFTLRRALGDTRTEAKFIETVARRGYRFVASVNLSEDGTSATETNENGLGESPILAVLPFVNATGDESLEYLAEGVCENIINSLSRISKLRVMSRSAVFRYKGRDIEPRIIYEDLGVDVLLLGKIISPPSGLRINVVLVNAATGWQLWGDSFKCELNKILELQDEVVRQVSAALGIQLSGDEEQRVTARYTENSQAYQSYIEGRFYWSRYTRTGIEKAIERFRKAIKLDQNYALAFSAVIDCYLRLTTNYLLPESFVDEDLEIDIGSHGINQTEEADSTELDRFEAKIRLRHEWDWKGAEREIKRASELKAHYPTVHQWYAAYLYAHHLYETTRKRSEIGFSISSDRALARQIPSISLTINEQAQVFCTIAREQIAVGNYEAACLVLDGWLSDNRWPKLDSLSAETAADLLFTLGVTLGYSAVASSKNRRQKRAASYLNGSIALLDHLGSRIRAAESRIELARCYYREGLFEEARQMLAEARRDLPEDETELRPLCLILEGTVARDTGRLHDSITNLRTALAHRSGHSVLGRCHFEIATTLKELAITESLDEYFSEAGHHFQAALYEWEAIGNHRLVAAAENNFGYLLLCLGLTTESEIRLTRALELFKSFSDELRGAQVHETLTRLYLAKNDLRRAHTAIQKAVKTLETTDGEAILAEALTTKGVVAQRLGRHQEAKQSFEGAYRVAERCGDQEGAERALLTMYDEMATILGDEEIDELSRRIQHSLSDHSSLGAKREEVLARIEADLRRRHRT
jgi:DNA-binding winged helix-turn-helix (wHTH) protein/tetratricopeptide (TPR) repeat protein